MANVLLHGGPLDGKQVKAASKGDWRRIEKDGSVYVLKDGKYVYTSEAAEAAPEVKVRRTTSRVRTPKEVD